MSASSPSSRALAREPMRVAFVIDRWQPRRGGAEQAFALFARHLGERGHDVHVFAREGEDVPGTLHLVRARALRRGERERRFAAAALAAACDAGCALSVGLRHLPRIDLYWPHGGSHAETLALLGKPVRGRHRTFIEFERELLERGGARLVACVSELVRAELARRYPACTARLRVVPAGVDLARFHPAQRAAARARLAARVESELGARAQGPYLGFAARNARLKGLDVLLEALSALAHLPWTLVAGGPKHPSAWLRRARRLGLPRERVLVRSELPSLELAGGVDLAAIPTRRDTASLYLLEALACGTPVLASARAGASECIGAGAGEVIGDPEDRAAWSAALARWIARSIDAPADPGAARRCVERRGLEAWMQGMEALLLELRGAAPVG